MFDWGIKAGDVRKRIKELRAEMEPINHTSMSISWYNDATNTGCTTYKDVFYKDHLNYEHMPPVTQAPETKAEHAAWWEWHEQQGE